MLQEINRQLKPFVEDKRSQLRFLNQIDLLEKEKKQAQGVLVQLEQELNAEYEDVKKLEQLGPKRFFSNFSGNFERRYEKEYEEYLQARMKRDECISLIFEIDRTIERLEHKLEVLGDIDETYESLLAMKEELLKGDPTGIGAQYFRHLERMANLESDQKELNEAFEVGQQAEKSLRMILKNLGKASRIHSTQTNLFHKWAFMIKTSKSYAVRVQRYLVKYQKEVQDVCERMHFSASSKLGPLLNFHDLFIKSLTTQKVMTVWEYMHHDRTKGDPVYNAMISGLHRVREALKWLMIIQNALNRRLSSIEKRLDKAELDRILILEEMGLENST